MIDAGQLAGFMAAVAVLILVPGPNTVLILAHSLRGGRAAGLATVLGIELGTLAHTSAAALGISALFSTSALAFAIVKYAGATFLAYLGLRALRDGGRGTKGAARIGTPVSVSQAFWRAVLTNVLNPKVAIFFLALLPQFVRPERGHLALQLVWLGLVVAAMGLTLGSLMALAAASLSRWLSRDSVARWQGRITGGVLLGLGARLALAGRH